MKYLSERDQLSLSLIDGKVLTLEGGTHFPIELYQAEFQRRKALAASGMNMGNMMQKGFQKGPVLQGVNVPNTTLFKAAMERNAAVNKIFVQASTFNASDMSQ